MAIGESSRSLSFRRMRGGCDEAQPWEMVLGGIHMQSRGELSDLIEVPGRAVLIGLQSPTFEAVHDPLKHLEVLTQDVSKLVEKICADQRRDGRPDELKELGHMYYRMGLPAIFRAKGPTLHGSSGVPLADLRELAASPSEYRREGDIRSWI